LLNDIEKCVKVPIIFILSVFLIFTRNNAYSVENSGLILPYDIGNEDTVRNEDELKTYIQDSVKKRDRMYFKNLSKWIVNDESFRNVEAVQRISEELSVSIPTAKLLFNRGCTSPELAKRFIGKEEEQLYDPFLLKDMDKAASRIADAVSAEERIVIYGDYDVDGVTSVSSLYLYLKSYGADVSYHIPCRMTEGYGMSEAVIDKLCEEGCELIVTVDTGITAVHEIAHAKSLGIDVVVTDHHECHEILPGADAIVNPCRPDCEYPF
jgi:single-stranded-DNA-specific exonuclease